MLTFLLVIFVAAGDWNPGPIGYRLESWWADSF